MFKEESLQQLYRYSYSLTMNENDAYDLLQNALEKFIRLEVDARNPVAYMKSMIHNGFIDECRRQKVVQFESIEETNLPTDFDVQTLEDMSVNEDMAKKIMQSLEPDEREIMYFWAIEGFSTSEIASKLEKPKGTILSKIYRMRKKIIENFPDSSNDVMEGEL